jgi:hypothetical protein
MPEAEIRKWASDKERHLESLFANCTVLPAKPQKDKMKKLLLECLDYHYGTLEKCIELPDKYKTTLQEVKSLIDKAGI